MAEPTQSLLARWLLGPIEGQNPPVSIEELEPVAVGGEPRG